MLKRGSVISKFDEHLARTVGYLDPGKVRDRQRKGTDWAEGSIVWALLAGVIAIVIMIIHGL